MASRFACIATSRRRRALTTSLSAPAVRMRRASASLRRAAGAWRELDGTRHQRDRADRPDVTRAPTDNPLPPIISRR